MGKGRLRAETPMSLLPSGPFNNVLVRDVGQEGNQGTHLPNPASWPECLRMAGVRKGASESLGEDRNFKEEAPPS